MLYETKNNLKTWQAVAPLAKQRTIKEFTLYLSQICRLYGNVFNTENMAMLMIKPFVLVPTS